MWTQGGWKGRAGHPGRVGLTYTLCCASLLSRVWLFATPRTEDRQAPLSVGILQARILQWVAMPSLQGLFPTQGWNPGLPRCRQVLYSLSHQGSPRMLEWVVFLFSRKSFWSRNRTRVSCTAGRFFTSWATREAHIYFTPVCKADSWWEAAVLHIELSVVLCHDLEELVGGEGSRRRVYI